MQTLIDLDRARVFAIPVHDDAGVREGMLIEGPQGWGEFSPSASATPAELTRWLTAATEPGTVGWPDAVRGRVPVAATVPAVDAERARRIVTVGGCRTAEVAVVGDGPSRDGDLARVAAVRAALGPAGALRCHVAATWDVATAAAVITELAEAAGGLEFVVQPCASLAELVELRRRVDVPIGIDVAKYYGPGRLADSLVDAADVAVLDCGPLGGVRRALRVAESVGLPCTVTSTAASTIGLGSAVALAAALPDSAYACGLGERMLLAGDLVGGSRSLTAVDGYLPAAPMPPGPAPDLLDRYAVTDPQRLRWWRDRLQTAQLLG